MPAVVVAAAAAAVAAVAAAAAAVTHVFLAIAKNGGVQMLQSWKMFEQG